MAYIRQTWTTRWGRNLLAIVWSSRANSDLLVQRLEYLEQGLAAEAPSYQPQVWDNAYGRSLVGALYMSAIARNTMCVRLDYVEAGVSAALPGYLQQHWQSRWGRSLVGAWPTSSISRDTTCQRLDHIEVGVAAIVGVPVQGVAVSAAISLLAKPWRRLNRRGAIAATPSVLAHGQTQQAGVVVRNAALSATSSVASRPWRRVVRNAALSATSSVASRPWRRQNRQAAISRTATITVAGQVIAGDTEELRGVLPLPFAWSATAGPWQRATATTAGGVVGVSGQTVPKSTSVRRVSLASRSTPGQITSVTLEFRASKSAGAGAVVLRAALYEGATNRSGDLESSALTTSPAAYSLVVSNAAAANITSWSDLEVRFWGYSASGQSVNVEVQRLRLKAPV